MLTGAGLWWYFKSVEKERMEKIAQKGAKNAVVAGKADIGGDFELIDSKNGKTFHSDALKGGFSLLYFGFTHCPDVCPDELEKIASAIDLVDKEMKESPLKPVTPVFITLDPERDGVKQVASYVKEFHPRMIGLTGSTESIAKVTKSYRVYFTKAGVGEMTNNTSNTKDDDYLIDHSIITYLLDPKGEFVTFYGKNYTDRAMADSMLSIMKSYSE
jgi:protein SCO1/2